MSRSPRLALAAVSLVVLLGVILAAAAADARAVPSGQRFWEQIITDVVTVRGDAVICAARGANDSVYLCGTYDHWDNDGYLWVARYAANGNQIWLRKYDETLGSVSTWVAIAVDRDGDLIVAGQITLAGNADMLVLKYSRDGVLRWEHIFDGVAGGDDGATDVVVDGSGGVYVAAASTGLGSGVDYLVVKYSSAGAYRWESRYVGPVADDAPRAIAIDGGRATYVTGTSTGGGGDGDIVTVKTSAAGKRLWARRWDGGAHLADEAYDVAVAAGGVYVDGAATSGKASKNVALLRYTPSGIRSWARTWDGPGHGADLAQRLAVDAKGNAWTAGATESAAGDDQALLIKWDAGGGVVWTRREAGGAGLDSAFHDLTIDAHGTAWAAGSREAVSGDHDLLVGKYSSKAKRVWVRNWDGHAHDHDAAYALCLSGSTSLYVGGATSVPGDSTEPLLIKYRR